MGTKNLETSTRKWGEERGGRPRLAPLVRFSFVVVLLGGLAGACVTPSEARWKSGLVETERDVALFRAPKHWKTVRERDESDIYQIDLKHRKGAGRMMVAQFENVDDVDNVSAYLRKIQNDVLAEIEERVSVESDPRLERVVWSNGVVGVQTAFSGVLERRRISVRGVAVRDGRYTYIVYVLFPRSEGDHADAVFRSVLETLRPVRDAEIRSDRSSNTTACGVGPECASLPPRGSELDGPVDWSDAWSLCAGSGDNPPRTTGIFSSSLRR